MIIFRNIVICISKGSVELLRTNRLSGEALEEISLWGSLKGYGYGLGVRTLIDKSSGSIGPCGEFGWGGAADATVLVDPDNEFSFFCSHHMLNPQEDYYQPRL